MKKYLSVGQSLTQSAPAFNTRVFNYAIQHLALGLSIWLTPLESRSYRRADCSKQGQHVPTSVETYLKSPRLGCLKREQRQGRHLSAIKNTTHSFSESANYTVDLHHFTFHLPFCSLGRINFINLAEVFYVLFYF